MMARMKFSFKGSPELVYMGKDEFMKTLSKPGKRVMSGNAVRVARFAEKMRDRGMRKITLWVSMEKESAIRTLLSERRDPPPMSPPLTSPAGRFTLSSGAKYTSLSARPRERSGIFFVPPPFHPHSIPSCRACGEYKTPRGNKPAASTRYLAPGAHFVRPLSKAKYLSLRCP